MNRLTLYRLFFKLSGRIAPNIAMQKAFDIFHTPHAYQRNDVEILCFKQARRFSFAFEEHTIAGYRWGEQGNPKVLMVHGWTGVATSMYKIIDALVMQGYEVISYDAIGHGESSGNQSVLYEWADCLRAMNAHVGEVQCIIAHSLGGTTTFVASKLGLQTKQIVLLAPFCNPVEIIHEWFGVRMGIPKNVLDRLPAYFWDRQKEGLMKYGEEWEEIFTSDFHVPTLIVYDQEDKEVSFDNVNVCYRCWSWAEFYQTKGLGHRRLLYDTSVVEKIVSFMGVS